MVRPAWLLAAGMAFAVFVPSNASAQIRNFDRRQQASLQAYLTTMQAQERARTQGQFDRYSRAIDTQQFRLLEMQRKQRDQNETLTDLADGTLDRPIARHSRGAMSFGDPHFNSPYYQRLSPYYDYNFIRSRNRTFNSVGMMNNMSNYGW